MATILKFLNPGRPQRLRVNLNAVSADGAIRARASDFVRLPRIGAAVLIFEPTDEIEGSATVARLNDRTGLVYLDVAWESLRDTPPAISHSAKAAASPSPARRRRGAGIGRRRGRPAGRS
jgi:hypothetical protein